MAVGVSLSTMMGKRHMCPLGQMKQSLQVSGKELYPKAACRERKPSRDHSCRVEGWIIGLKCGQKYSARGALEIIN